MAEINSLDNFGNSLLHVALLNCNIKEAESLLRRGSDPNLPNRRGSTALHIICERCSDMDLVNFLEICNNMQLSVKIDAQEMLGRTPLFFAVDHNKLNMVKVLLMKGADPNLANTNGATPLHIMCNAGHDDDLLSLFFEITDVMQKPVIVDILDKSGRTPLYLAVCQGKMIVVETLLRRGANPHLTLVNGTTLLHVISERDADDDLLVKFFEICDDLHRSVSIDTLNGMGETPLHSALSSGKRRNAEVLLNKGADPNLAAVDGFTALHIVSEREVDDDLAEIFLNMIDELQTTVQIDALDNSGRTPLWYALRQRKKQNVEILLRRGADPSLADIVGLRPLHHIALHPKDDDGFAEKFMEIIDVIGLTVQVDAVDHLGRTPLHLALRSGKREMVETLLRRGANPNLAQVGGNTPLHIICSRQHDDGLVEFFLKINDEIQQTVWVDAKRDSKWTPLKMAVTNLLPNAVGVLLDRGANLTDFFLPATKVIAKRFIKSDHSYDKLKLASGLLSVLERLEERGYVLCQNDILMIFKLFVKFRLFEKSSSLVKSLDQDEKFASMAKEITIIPSLSLYKLIQLRPEEENKVLTNMDYFNIRRSDNLNKIPEKYLDLCLTHLCEKMSRAYFKKLALAPLLKLSRDRFPILCCDEIINYLNNEDISKVYQAALLETDYDPETHDMGCKRKLSEELINHELIKRKRRE